MANPVPPGHTRVIVDLPSAVWEELDRMARERQVSKTEMLRRCISTERARLNLQARGAHLLARYPNHRYETIDFPY